MYIDSIPLVAFTGEEAIRKYQDSRAKFTSMNMNLRQFLSNVLNIYSISSYIDGAINIQDRMQYSSSVLLLGLQWDFYRG